MLPKSFLASVVGFNGSPNCNRKTPQTFYESYLNRQKFLDKKFKLQREAGTLKHYKLWKAYFHGENVKIAEGNKWETLSFMEHLLMDT